MRTRALRLVAAGVATSVTLGWLSPLAQAQPVTPQAESVPLESAEQPILPTVPTSPDPSVAQVQPAPPPGQQPGPVMPAPPVQPTPPPAPAPVVAPPPAPVAQPDLFQETLKAEARAAERKQALYGAGAVVTNIFLIPGRAITCALGAGVGVAVLALTFGTGYKTAAGAFDEGCGGKWVVNGDDLRPEGSRAFEWER